MPAIYRPAAEADDMVYPIACVNLPRSGHHLLVRLLERIYGQRFGYCSYHRHEPGDGCCGVFPCVRPRVTLTKQHDFRLDAPIPKDRALLIQVRRFDEAVISNYELHVGNGRRPDNLREFRRFAKVWAKHYHGFIKKWVAGSVSVRRLVVDYSELTQDTVATLLAITAFLHDQRFDHLISEAIADLDHVSHRDGRPLVIKSAGVVNLRSIEGFRHFDPVLFKELNRIADGR